MPANGKVPIPSVDYNPSLLLLMAPEVVDLLSDGPSDPSGGQSPHDADLVSEESDANGIYSDDDASTFKDYLVDFFSGVEIF